MWRERPNGSPHGTNVMLYNTHSVWIMREQHRVERFACNFIIDRHFCGSTDTKTSSRCALSGCSWCLISLRAKLKISAIRLVIYCVNASYEKISSRWKIYQKCNVDLNDRLDRCLFEISVEAQTTNEHILYNAHTNNIKCNLEIFKIDSTQSPLNKE